MREIKLRAWVKTWDDSDGEMLQLPMQVLRFDFEEGWVVAFGESGFWACECYEGRKPHQFELMQFTGLIDKNGKEIYEGDLLEENPGYIFEAVWDTEYAKFRLQWRTKAIQYPEWNRGRKMAVIGNIYEHPELLETP